MEVKKEYIYSTAIVLSALILGFFYALAHKYELYRLQGSRYFFAFNHWSGSIERTIPDLKNQATTQDIGDAK